MSCGKRCPAGKVSCGCLCQLPVLPGTHTTHTYSHTHALAQMLVSAAGYNAQVTDYQGLLDLAKTQGSFGTGEKVRGACKRCGGLGHMTRWAVSM
eukprot:1157505-Pelagomonas_calceolata.AAC.5